MCSFYFLKKCFFTGLLISISYGLTAQVMSNDGASVTIQSGATVIVQGGLTNAGAGVITNDGLLMVEGDLINNSSMNVSDGSGVVALMGSSSQSVGGMTNSRFYDLQVDNGMGVVLDQGIIVDNALEMVSGDVDLNGQNITLSETASLVGEEDSRRIFGASGEIQTVRDLGTPAGMNIGNLGLEITSSTNMGSTRISRGHAAQTVGAGASIERYFDVLPTSNSNLDADLRMYYFASELNSQDAATLALFRLNAGATNWTPAGGTSDVAGGFVEQSGIDAMALWTLSADGTTGIEDLRPALEVGFFPNPMTSGQSLTVAGLEAGSYDFALFDARGRLVAKEAIMAFGTDLEVEVELPHMALGMYTIQVLSKDYRPVLGKLVISTH